MKTVKVAAGLAGGLRGLRVAFTGRLATVTHRQACELVRRAGGEPSAGVSGTTDVLVVGMAGWPLCADGSITRKLAEAEALQQEGGGIRIVPETGFLEMAGLAEKQAQLDKPHTAEEICRMLELDVGVLRRLEHFGLVRPHEGRYDFQDIVSIRTILRLLRGGVSLPKLATSIHKLAGLLPGTERPLSQLEIIADSEGTILADLGEVLLAPDGQLRLNFERPKEPAPMLRLRHRAELTAEEWFGRGLAAEEQGDAAGAMEAYRQAVRLNPQFPEAHFNIGNLLYAAGESAAAEERYRMATELEGQMAEAWFNLAYVQEQREDLAGAGESLARALEADPEYAEAHFNLALVLEKQGRHEEAVGHWKSYLRLNPMDPDAAIAAEYLAG